MTIATHCNEAEQGAKQPESLELHHMQECLILMRCSWAHSGPIKDNCASQPRMVAMRPPTCVFRAFRRRCCQKLCGNHITAAMNPSHDPYQNTDLFPFEQKDSTLTAHVTGLRRIYQNALTGGNARAHYGDNVIYGDSHIHHHGKQSLVCHIGIFSFSQ